MFLRRPFLKYKISYKSFSRVFCTAREASLIAWARKRTGHTEEVGRGAVLDDDTARNDDDPVRPLHRREPWAGRRLGKGLSRVKV